MWHGVGRRGIGVLSDGVTTKLLVHVALLGAHVPTIVAVGHVATHALGSAVEFFQECLSAMLRLARHRKLGS